MNRNEQMAPTTQRANGRFAKQDAGRRPYEPPALVSGCVRLVTTEELEAGFESTGPDGTVAKRDFRVLFHMVVEPEDE